MDEELRRIREKKLKEMADAQKKATASKGGDVLVVTSGNFHETLSTHPRVVIDFWAEWCGPCRMVGPVVEKLAREFAGQITFGKCNTDQNSGIAMQFGISAIPTLLLFSRGKLVHRVIGAYPEDALRSQVVRAFGLPS